jgi:hypothetical protein
VRFAPGDWFNTPAWRSLNKQVATVSAGALKLSTERNDQSALFLACYFSTLARMNGNRPNSRLRADTLAEKSGLKQTYSSTWQTARRRSRELSNDWSRSGS